MREIATSVLRFGWSPFLCVGVFAHAGFAGDPTVITRLNSGLSVVPFAVPVATPVAVLQPGGVTYAYQPASEIDEAKLRAEFEAFKRWRLSQNVEPATPADATPFGPSAKASVDTPATNATPLLGANCFACHRGAQAKGGVRLDGPLSSDERLAAIRAVLSGEMPKGKTLAPDHVGALLFELSDGAVSTSSSKGE